MASQFELVASDSEGCDDEVPTTSSPLKRRVIACVVGLAVIGLVAFAAASQQAGQSLRNGNMQNTEVLTADIGSTFYFVKSTWKDTGDTAEWWKKSAAMMSDPVATKAATAEDTKMGLHYLFFLPTGEKSTMYGIWEAKHGTSKQALDDHLNHDTKTQCGKLSNAFKNEISVIPSKLAPFPYSFFNAPAAPALRRLAGAFGSSATHYLVHHTFRSDKDVAPWWKQVKTMMADKKAFMEFTKKQKEEGYVNTFFAPLAPNGPIYCLWEVAPGKTKDDLQSHLDSTPPMSGLRNVVMSIPNKLTGGDVGPYLPQ